MASVDPLSALGAGSTAAATAATSSQGLGALNQNDFLTLMIAQLKQQNPLSPADPSQFLSQLAQMTEVSSMQNMQSDLSSSLRSSQASSAVGLVGHQVLAPATTVSLATGGTVSGAVDTPAGASSVTVTLSDSSGKAVRTITTPAASDLTSFSWDGLTDAGTFAPAGQYQISGSANVVGATQSASPLVVSRVASVTIDPSTQTLDLNTDNGTVALSSVRVVQ
jgi:flagellar basal-body rod modification protein FlgD